MLSTLTVHLAVMNRHHEEGDKEGLCLRLRKSRWSWCSRKQTRSKGGVCLRRVPQLAAYIVKLEQKLRGIIDWGDDGALYARSAWLQRVRSVRCQWRCVAHSPAGTPLRPNAKSLVTRGRRLPTEHVVAQTHSTAVTVQYPARHVIWVLSPCRPSRRQRRRSSRRWCSSSSGACAAARCRRSGGSRCAPRTAPCRCLQQQRR